jgi:hypothetical protein
MPPRSTSPAVELCRARFGGGSEEVIGWLAALPQPLRGCYEAGGGNLMSLRFAARDSLRSSSNAPA